MQDQKPENLKRRGFLLAAGVGGAGAVAAAVAVSGRQPEAPVAVVKPEEKTGSYTETRHVSNYYRTARI
jgi:nitrous oxide reductase